MCLPQYGQYLHCAWSQVTTYTLVVNYSIKYDEFEAKTTTCIIINISIIIYHVYNTRIVCESKHNDASFTLHGYHEPLSVAPMLAAGHKINVNY